MKSPRAALIAALLAMSSAPALAQGVPMFMPVDTTYSIIAVDPETGQLGMGVQSKALSVGNRTITGMGGVAMVAHQSSSNPMYGAVIIDAIQRGMTPEDALAFALRADESPNSRQVAVIDIHGRSAAWTSPTISDWAGHQCYPTFCVQGNTLTGPEVIEAMAEAFEAAEGPLAERLLAALDAGQAAGGDRRGMQGAALYVVQPLVRAGFDDTLVDIRVDDHAEPLVELRRILQVTRSSGMMGGINNAIDAGDLAGALERATAARDMAPTFDLPYLAIAQIQMLQGETDAALDTLEEVIALNVALKAQLLRNADFEPLYENARFIALTTP
jgi:uncharacterized Ntn-hydrolase superfamily protein